MNLQGTVSVCTLRYLPPTANADTLSLEAALPCPLFSALGRPCLGAKQQKIKPHCRLNPSRLYSPSAADQES